MVAALALACTRVPSGVIAQDDMAYVLADMYMAESYVDQNYQEFSTDSARRLLKQSVLAKYGYVSADFDSSLMWYGMHSDIYMKVNDRVIEILKQRDKEIGSAIMQSNASFAGDSVDVWSGARYAMVHRRLPSRFVSFEIGEDDNQESGDTYSWRVKMEDANAKSIRWVMLAQYTDSSYDYLNTVTSAKGWNEAFLATDSSKTIKSLKGYFEPMLENSGKDIPADYAVWIDSISLIRKRVNPEEYGVQRSRLHILKELKPVKKKRIVHTDTIVEKIAE